MKNGKAKQLQPIFIVTACEPYAPRRSQSAFAGTYSRRLRKESSL